MLRLHKELRPLATAVALVIGTGTMSFAQSAPGTPVGPSLAPTAANRQVQVETLKTAGLLQLAHDTRQLQVEANQRAALSAEQGQIGAKILRDRLAHSRAASGRA